MPLCQNEPAPTVCAIDGSVREIAMEGRRLLKHRVEPSGGPLLCSTHKYYAARAFLLSLLFVVLPAGVHGGTPPESSPIPLASQQLLLVRTSSWWATTGTLARYEREGGSSWRLVDAPEPVNVGRAGMAWGRGLHASPTSGSHKREGDGRAPAGAFRLSSAFGVAETLPIDSHGFPYRQSLSTSYCVEDTRSTYYNQIVDSTRVRSSVWEQRSGLLRPDGLFNWGIVVEQNAPDIKKGAGSCVFLHVWRGANRPTAGCTSMSSPELEQVIRWLDPVRDPILIQLPDAELRARRDAWGLP
jgi:L,D-peptidoglycan transpeptidase YkuD (ErfK/YbiS/YcfS/YnhG family)